MKKTRVYVTFWKNSTNALECMNVSLLYRRINSTAINFISILATVLKSKTADCKVLGCSAVAGTRSDFRVCVVQKFVLPTESTRAISP